MPRAGPRPAARSAAGAVIALGFRRLERGIVQLRHLFDHRFGHGGDACLATRAAVVSVTGIGSVAVVGRFELRAAAGPAVAAAFAVAHLGQIDFPGDIRFVHLVAEPNHEQE